MKLIFCVWEVIVLVCLSRFFKTDEKRRFERRLFYAWSVLSVGRERNYASEKLLCIHLPLTQPAEITANINTRLSYGEIALLLPHAQFKQNG